MSTRRLWASLLDAGVVRASRLFAKPSFRRPSPQHRPGLSCPIPSALGPKLSIPWLKALCVRTRRTWAVAPPVAVVRARAFSRSSNHRGESLITIPQSINTQNVLTLSALGVYNSLFKSQKQQAVGGVGGTCRQPVKVSSHERLICNLNDIIKAPPAVAHDKKAPMCTDDAVLGPSLLDEDAARMPPQERALSAGHPPAHDHVEQKLFFRDKVDPAGRLVLRKEDLDSPKRWKALGQFLSSSPWVTRLRLQGMDISKAEAKQLGKGVLKEIRHITFCENSLGINERCLEYICALLLCCELLESAAFLRQSLTDMHVPALLKFATKSPNLNSLSLCWNGIESTENILTRLRSCSNPLRLVDLSYNLLGAQNVMALAAFEKENTRFRVNTRHNQPHEGLARFCRPGHATHTKLNEGFSRFCRPAT